MLNLKVDMIESEEGPALGGAILAAVACGEFESIEDAVSKLVKVTETIEPDEELVEKYEERYNKFKKIYPTVKNLHPTKTVLQIFLTSSFIIAPNWK